MLTDPREVLKNECGGGIDDPMRGIRLHHLNGPTWPPHPIMGGCEESAGSLTTMSYP